MTRATGCEEIAGGTGIVRPAVLLRMDPKGRCRAALLPLACGLACVLVGSLIGACTGRKEDSAAQGHAAVSGELIVFHAGSLSVPFRELSALFMEKYPEVTVKAEAAGSRDCARKISDLNRPCDVLGSADFKVVSNLLMPEHADFNIRFATNEMAIAYTAHSRGCDRVDERNWPRLLLEEKVAFGRADPNRDPCGYRTVMTFQLAEKHYGIPGLAEKLASRNGSKYIRPKETDLLALLEAGEIDYLFIYRSVAEQHELDFLILPDEVNLKSQDLADLYRAAVIEVTGKKPGEFITRHGAPMVYSVTIPKNAPNQAAARAYVALLLSPDGRAIMKKNGQPCLTPARCDQSESLPASLEALCR